MPKSTALTEHPSNVQFMRLQLKSVALSRLLLRMLVLYITEKLRSADGIDTPYMFRSEKMKPIFERRVMALEDC